MINIITGIAYSALALYLFMRLRKTEYLNLGLGKWLPFAPLGLHLYSLYLAIETGNGQNLSLINILSMAALIIVLIIALYRIKNQAPHLMLFAALFAATISFLGLLPTEPLVQSFKGNPIGLWHVLLSILSFSLLLVAAIQSALVLLLNNKLRHNPADIHPLMPPLLQMERFLFDLVLAGVLALSAALILGFAYPGDMLAEQSLHKIILTVAAWFSFCTFIVGYKASRLSGIQFARYSLIAFALLAIGFVGSKLVIEYIIQRG